MRIGVGAGWIARISVAGLLLAGSLGLSGCQFFFQCQKASCTDSTSAITAGSTGDYAYVANSTAGTGDLAAYEISTGVPIAISGSPFNLNFVPTAMVIVPGNALMFIASSGGGIYAYTIAANGALSINNNQMPVASGTAAAMDVTPDGKYLFVLNSNAYSVTLTEYSITSTGGVLSNIQTQTSNQLGGNAAALKVAPSADFVAVALGTAGDAIFPLSSDLFSSTVSATGYTFSTTGVGDFGVTVDTSNNVYFARTGLVAVYSATTAGVLTATNNTTANSTTGGGDHSIALSSTGAYLYTGNATANTVSAFTNNGGTLGVVSGSPYNGPASVADVATDNSGKYLIAAGYNSGGVEEYAIGAGGTLTASSTTASTGASGITLLAVTH